jgi:hypothetical protein
MASDLAFNGGWLIKASHFDQQPERRGESQLEQAAVKPKTDQQNYGSSLSCLQGNTLHHYALLGAIKNMLQGMPIMFSSF